MTDGAASGEASADPGAETGGAAFVVELESFEGPIDLLLALAREQKVDLTRISVLALAEQYLAFIQRARELRLELRADYLVMAAWLAYLKSRLLLPAESDPQADDAESGAAMAEALQFQLRRLEAMQDAGKRLLARPRLGRDVFARGAPEGVTHEARPVYDLDLYSLLQAYARHRVRRSPPNLRIAQTDLFAIEDVVSRLQSMLGGRTGWQDLFQLLPPETQDPASGAASRLRYRSAVAATFAASLELVRDGQAELRQQRGPFAELEIRPRASGSPGGADESG